MQIKAIKEVRNYKEIIYFGMNLRQLIWSIIGVVLSVGCFLLLKDHLPMEVCSWLCILMAAPCAALGFIRWHGMYVEQIIPMMLRFIVSANKPILFKPQNAAMEIIKAYVADRDANKEVKEETEEEAEEEAKGETEEEKEDKNAENRERS